MSKKTQQPNSQKAVKPYRLFDKFRQRIGKLGTKKTPKKDTTKKKSGVSILGGLQDVNRYHVIWILMEVGFLVLFARAYWLHVVDSDYLIKKGDELITSKRVISTHRGLIYDRHGTPLAANAPLVQVAFSPYDYAVEYYALKRRIQMARDDEERANLEKRLADRFDLAKLAAVSGVSQSALEEAVKINQHIDVNDKQAVQSVLPSGAGSRYFVLLDWAPPATADTVTSLNFVAVSSKTSDRRFYLQPEPMAQLIGHMYFPDSRYMGLMGMENAYEETLAGKNGQVLTLRGNGGVISEVKELTPAIEGKHLRLTIDSRLQYILYKELEELGRVQSARFSSGIIVDAKNGEVLAMASWPSFNPNDLNSKRGVAERNRPVTDTFEPGSVVKPITVAAALESGKYSLGTHIDTGGGSMQLGGHRVRDGASYGAITMGKLIQKSSNVASAKIALSLPSTAMVDAQRKFGFGQKTPMELYGEKAGQLENPKDNATRATLAYGYGQAVTLAQIAQAYTAFANEGVLSPLKIDKNKPTPTPTQIISTKHAKDITNMMISVTETGGTGTAAAINGYHVAGKTGTSRRTKPSGGYYTDQYRNIFAGFAPATNPRFVVVILAEDPRKDKYAGQSVAPVFAKVMKESLRLYNVPYDKPITAK